MTQQATMPPRHAMPLHVPANHVTWQAVTVMTRTPLGPSRLRASTDTASAYHAAAAAARPSASQRRLTTTTSMPLVQPAHLANALGTSAPGSPAVAMQLAGTGTMAPTHEADAIVAVSVAPSHTTSSNHTGESASLEKEAVAALLEALSQGELKVPMVLLDKLPRMEG